MTNRARQYAEQAVEFVELEVEVSVSDMEAITAALAAAFTEGYADAGLGRPRAASDDWYRTMQLVFFSGGGVAGLAEQEQQVVRHEVVRAYQIGYAAASDDRSPRRPLRDGPRRVK